MPKKTKEEIHRNMSRIRGKDTSIELLLRKELYARGYHYRTNMKGLPGRPDIVLLRAPIAIFCDGDFFHGYDYNKIISELKTNSSYWIEKIEANRKLDRKNDALLAEKGFLVLHFWEHEIKDHLNEVADEVEENVLRLNLAKGETPEED
ncbi:MAG: very short patch repair endonuclease [Bacilli bacterium]|jgi:DNA mismatch endonuclease (patch repair protein)